MLDHTARKRAAAPVAPATSDISATDEHSSESVPFQNRDFRASARKKASPSFVGASPVVKDAPEERISVAEIPEPHRSPAIDVPVPPQESVPVPEINRSIEAVTEVGDRPVSEEFVVIDVPDVADNEPPDVKSETAAPQAVAPETVTLETAVPETAAPETVTSETAVPQIAAPEAAAPEAVAADVATLQVESPSIDVEAPVAELPKTETVVIDSEVPPVTEPPANGFARLDLDEDVVRAVEKAGYLQPTDVQAEIIPHLLAGRDVLVQSQTGTGKTAAFALPILSCVEIGKNASRVPQVLVLTPTRELAVQVAESFSRYGAHLSGFSVVAIYGGQSYDAQFRQLKRGVQVVVGTPGRVIDHIKRGTLDLSDLRCLVLDEADEMLNMGFLDDVRFVLEHTPDERQVALFSATLPGPIRTIAEQYLRDPARVTIKRKTMTADSIRQRAIFVPSGKKMDVLKRVLEAEETEGVLIFAKTRESTVAVADKLSQDGFNAVALNGDMPQSVRERTVDQLKSGRLDIVVATDVAARGLDVARISHVINYDVPNDNESYIHRVGRTGRAGRAGEAIIFLKKSHRGRLRQIERATRQAIEIIDVPSADDINARRTSRFIKTIAEAAANEDLSVFEGLIAKCADETHVPMEKIAAALAHIGQQGRPFFVQETLSAFRGSRDDDDDRGRYSRDRGERGDRFDRDSEGSRGDRRGRRAENGSSAVEAGMVRYRISVGHEDGVKPGNIVGAVANEGGVDGEVIGAIRIYSTWSTIDLPEGMPDHVRQVLQSTRVAGRPLQLREYRDDDGDRNGHGGGYQGKPQNRRFQGGKKQFGPPGGKKFRGKKPVGAGPRPKGRHK